MNKICVQCGNEFEAKRERRMFCSDVCRATFHQNIKAAKKNAGNNKELAAVYKQLKDIMSGTIKSATVEKENGKPVFKIKIELPEKNAAENQDRIKQLEQELAHPPKTFSTQVMKHYYFSERQKELNSLRAANKK